MRLLIEHGILGFRLIKDAFDVKMKRLLSTGDGTPAGELAEVEKVHIEDGVKGAFQRDPKTGVILTDAKGFATWINADGSPPPKTYRRQMLGVVFC